MAKKAKKDKIIEVSLDGKATIRITKIPENGIIDLNEFDETKNLTSLVGFSIDRSFRNPYAGECTLIMPKYVEQVEKEFFRSNFATKVVWPKSCPVIPEKCFIHSDIKELEGIENVTEIQEGAFNNCSNITVFHMPQKVTKIPVYCFGNCHSLERIKGAENITEIQEGAFKACSNMTEFHLPKKVTKIPTHCFSNCSSLKEITGLEHISSIEKGAFMYTKVEEVDLPESVVEIPDECFAFCFDLKKINLSHVSRIGKRAFMYTKLKNMDLSDSVVEVIEEHAFSNTHSTELKIPFSTIVAEKIFS